MCHWDEAGKYNGRVEGQSPEVPVVGEKVGVGLGKETDEDQEGHEDHVAGLPELQVEGQDHMTDTMTDKIR